VLYGLGGGSGGAGEGHAGWTDQKTAGIAGGGGSSGLPATEVGPTTVSVTGGEVFTITIGAGGAAGSTGTKDVGSANSGTGTDGSAGTNSTIVSDLSGTLLTATGADAPTGGGGQGGENSIGGTAGTGGSATGANSAVGTAPGARKAGTYVNLDATLYGYGGSGGTGDAGSWLTGNPTYAWSGDGIDTFEAGGSGAIRIIYTQTLTSGTTVLRSETR